MPEEKIDGIYFEQKQIAAGTMGTARTHDAAHELHYWAKSTSGGEVVLYYLKPDGTATALEMERMPRADFEARFQATPKDRFVAPTVEDKKKADAAKKVAVAEQHLEKKEFHAAAFEFGQAVKQDDSNLKAHLGKGKAHMELGDIDKAKESFEKLATIDAIYDSENKHLFNEYGIELRKGQMYELALQNYQKAIDIDPQDPALHFNMARAYYADGNKAEAIACLKKALTLDPAFEEAKMLAAAINREQ